MKPLIADVHTHSIVSGHAFGTVREMAAAAAERNLKILGVTEHGPGTPGTCDPIYFWNFFDAPRNLYGVEMLYGCEINVLPGGKLSLEEQYIKHLDYAVVGIHAACYHDQGIRANTDNLIACMQHEKVRFVSHPDDDRFPLDYPALVKAAKERNVGLEVNNSSLRKAYLRPGSRENYGKMLPLCAELGVNILINSDAHDPNLVGNFHLARKLVEEVGFPDAYIVNNDAEKLKAFLGIKNQDALDMSGIL